MRVAIIGCGYLGQEVAKKLVEKKYFVTATTKNVINLKTIASIAQKSFLMKGDDLPAMKILLQENDAIILSIAVNGSNDMENTFLKTARTIQQAALETKESKTLIYTSKSSIYGDHAGQWVDESASLNAKGDEAKILKDTENVILNLKDLNWKVTVLRLAQIYGPNRTIIDIFKSYYKDIIPGHSEYYTNMVHVQDAANAIIYVLEHSIEGVYNVADDAHPTRKEFANILCRKTNLKIPSFDPKLADFPDYNKRVANYRIKEKGFEFTYPERVF